MNRKNFLSNYFITAINLIFPIIIIPIISNKLSPLNFGIFATMQVIFGYLFTLTDFGLSISSPQSVANRSDDEIEQYFWDSIGLRLLVATLLTIIYCVLGVLGHVPFTFLISIIILFTAFSFAIQPFWMTNALQETNKVIVEFVASKLFIGSILIFYCVYENSFSIIIFLLSLSNIIPSCVSFAAYVHKTRYSARRFRINFRRMKYIFKDCSSVAFSSFSSVLANGSVVTVAGIAFTYAEAGGISIPDKICRLGLSIVAPFTVSMLPYVSNGFKISYFEGVLRILTGIKVVVPFYTIFVAVVVIYAQKILLIFGEKFVLYDEALKILAVWSLFSVVNNFFGIQYFLGRGLRNVYSIFFQSSMIALLLLYFILPERLGIVGLPLSILTSEIIFTVFCLLYFVIKDRRVYGWEKSKT